MILSRTASEIQNGMWFISPHVTNDYLKGASQILNATNIVSHKEIEAGHIRNILDDEGNIINVDQNEIPEGSIGVVRCIGSMYKYGSWFNWGSDELVSIMKQFDNDSRIIGQIWHDDSGGGTVSSVPPYIDFLKNKKKPVVSLLDTCGSANYYKNCGTDHVMAENNMSAMFGSIGVMLSFYDFTKMLKEMGIVEHIIEADQSEDKNKAFKMALKGKYEMIKQEWLNPLAIKFQNDVKAARPKLKDVPGVLSGKMFYAEEALEIGLIDSIGNMEAAIEKVKLLASARSFMNI